MNTFSKIILILFLSLPLQLFAQIKYDAVKPQESVPELPQNQIDRLYTSLKLEPGNDQMRFELVNELINADRYEDAYRQLHFLSLTYNEDDYFKRLDKIVSEKRDSINNADIEYYTGLLKRNPLDKESVLKLASSYANLFYYHSSIELLEEYLLDIPKDQGLDVRFMYAQYCAWNYQWEKSLAQLDQLLVYEPDNLDFQLLRGQIDVWTINDLGRAEKLLLNVYANRPDDLNTISALVSLYSIKYKFDEAGNYLAKLMALAPRTPEVSSAGYILSMHKTVYDELKLIELKGEANRLAAEGKCYEAFPLYDEYIARRTPPVRDEFIEFGDIASCVKKYKIAIDAFNKALEEGFDYSTALKRAKVYYMIQDYNNAVRELEKLTKIKSDDDDARLYLADSYTAIFQLEKAEFNFNDIESRTWELNQLKYIYNRLVLLAEYYIRDKKYERASSVFAGIDEKTNIIEIRKAVDRKRMFMADMLAQDREFSEAAELLDYLHNSVTDDSLRSELNQHYIFLGEQLVQNNKLDDAKEIYYNLRDREAGDTTIYNLSERRLFLGDAFALHKNYGEAEDVYNDLLIETDDADQISIIKERISWLPTSDFSRIFTSVKEFLRVFNPTRVELNPFSDYYHDNQKFQFWDSGLRVDAGFLRFLSLGAIYSRTYLSNSLISRNIAQYKLTAGILFSSYTYLKGSFGILNIANEANRKIGEVSFGYKQPEGISIALSYQNNDARMIFYSRSLLQSRLNIDFFRVIAAYNFSDRTILDGYYNYFRLSDRNEGNDFQIRIGKRLLGNGFFGYEYFFSDFSFESSIYYAAQDFNSHSLWSEWNWILDKLELRLGGKIGYIPSKNFTLSELTGTIVYSPIRNLNINFRIGYGNNLRYDSSYSCINGSLTADWGVF